MRLSTRISCVALIATIGASSLFAANDRSDRSPAPASRSSVPETEPMLCGPVALCYAMEGVGYVISLDSSKALCGWSPQRGSTLRRVYEGLVHRDDLELQAVNLTREDIDDAIADRATVLLATRKGEVMEFNHMIAIVPAAGVREGIDDEPKAIDYPAGIFSWADYSKKLAAEGSTWPAIVIRRGFHAHGFAWGGFALSLLAVALAVWTTLLWRRLTAALALMLVCCAGASGCGVPTVTHEERVEAGQVAPTVDEVMLSLLLQGRPAGLHLGTIDAEAVASGRFRIRNDGPEEARIELNEVSCGCVDVAPHEITISPGELQEFTLTLDAARKPAGVVRQQAGFRVARSRTDQDAGQNQPPSEQEIQIGVSASVRGLWSRQPRIDLTGGVSRFRVELDSLDIPLDGISLRFDGVARPLSRIGERDRFIETADPLRRQEVRVAQFECDEQLVAAAFTSLSLRPLHVQKRDGRGEWKTLFSMMVSRDERAFSFVRNRQVIVAVPAGAGQVNVPLAFLPTIENPERVVASIADQGTEESPIPINYDPRSRSARLTVPYLTQSSIARIRLQDEQRRSQVVLLILQRQQPSEG